MNPIYVPNVIVAGLVQDMIDEVPWVNEQFRRQECFMSDIPRQYQYIVDGPVYDSVPMSYTVRTVMKDINERYGYNLDVCFLNYYSDHTKALGWHSDDSHPIDQTQPIAVVSIGQPREIWWKPIGYKGEIPAEWRQLLADGSLFIMPPGMQDTHRHRIPKGDREMGPRVSLTYRAWKKNL